MTDVSVAAEALENLKTSITAPTVESALSLPNGGHEDAPILSLFDNAVISRKDEPQAITAHQQNKSKRLTQELHHLLPSPKDLETILDASSQWWNVWRHVFPTFSDLRSEPFRECVSRSLGSENPAEVAKIILCIAISLDQMPGGFEEKKLSLPCPARELMEHYVNKVDELITSDDGIAATVDGIECIVLEAKFHINLGRPRRAWILFRRAIGFAQLLGIHRLGNNPIGDDPFILRQQSLWTHLFQGDRFLSLILGLPYAVPERFCTIHIPSDNIGLRPGEIYLLRISPLLGKIIDRNQDPSHMSFAATLRLDAELEEISQTLPADWWIIQPGLGRHTEEFFDKMITQFFHHQIRTLIHLPFMLKSALDKRYQYSHQAALESSREQIRHFSILREATDAGPFVCKLVDFQAFTAAMLILLNIMGYKQNSKCPTTMSANAVVSNESQEQDIRDWELIDETITCLRRASNEPGGIVALQSVKALEFLSCFRNKDAEKESECCQDKNCRISIPYFGTITIGPGSIYQLPPPKPAKHTPALSKLSSRTVRIHHPELPTPPDSTGTNQSSSINGASSTQPSPMSIMGQSFSNPINTPQFQENDQRIVVSGGDDQFVSFDNYMGLPQTDFLAFQSNLPMNQMYGGMGSSSGMENIESNNLGSWPYTNTSMGAVDLDQDWSWVGNTPFLNDWDNGLPGSAPTF